MLVAIDGRLAGAIAVADTVKPDSAAAIQQLHEQEKQVWMLTGDNPRTALAIAEHVGIPAERVLAGVSPQGKAQQIERLQQQGQVVAFVGDGINDAPALVQADVGMAVGTGTDIANDAANVTLVKGSLQSVLTALALSQKTMHTIKQNLFCSLGYNVILILAAACSPLDPSLRMWAPVLAAGAMALSSVSVVGNSLRLKNEVS
jgi:Cu+-exporting ATPase